MDIIDHCLKYVVSGHLRLEVTCSDEGLPDFVLVRTEDGREVYRGSAAELEHAAAVIVRLRIMAGDYRIICESSPEHGYAEPGELCEVCNDSNDFLSEALNENSCMR